MKKLFFAFILLGLTMLLRAQTVDSIIVEQAGELIKIHYKILNSTQYQTFRVTVFCAINGGLESKLKSLSGDFGENVIGGREEYMVLWDVLKDVEEVNNVNFSIRAELTSDNTPKGNSRTSSSSSKAYWQKKRFFLMPVAAVNPHYILLGGRIGFMGTVGISFGTFVGNKPYPPDHDENSYQSTGAYLDLTKRIVNKDNLQLHLLAGIAISDHKSTAATSYQGSMRWGPDLGVVAGISRLALYAGFSAVKPSFFSELDSEGTAWFNLGVGIRF